MIPGSLSTELPPLCLPDDFGTWRDRLLSAGSYPVIAVAGSRGKSTVVHLLARMADAADLRVATWTDAGVRVRGRKLRGELLPWTKALAQLASGELDLAIQELDWDMVHAVGLPRSAYPIVGVTNLCANSDACLLRPETLRAARALGTVREAAHPEAVFVLNGDDWAVAGGDFEDASNTILASLNRDTPLVRSHLQRRGLAVWVEDGLLRIGRGDEHEKLLPLAEVVLANAGLVGFQANNALTATGLACAVGLPTAAIKSALRSFLAKPELLPGSFNLLRIAGATIVVDLPSEPWFLRHPLRSVGHLPGERHVRVVGRLDRIDSVDLIETGRLLGRTGGLLIIHDEVGGRDRLDLLLQGVATNDVPSLVVQSKTETSALTALLKVVRPEDVVYILADDPELVLRRLKRSADHIALPTSPVSSKRRKDQADRNQSNPIPTFE